MSTTTLPITTSSQATPPSTKTHRFQLLPTTKTGLVVTICLVAAAAFLLYKITHRSPSIEQPDKTEKGAPPPKKKVIQEPSKKAEPVAVDTTDYSTPANEELRELKEAIDSLDFTNAQTLANLIFNIEKLYKCCLEKNLAGEYLPIPQLKKLRELQKKEAKLEFDVTSVMIECQNGINPIRAAKLAWQHQNTQKDLIQIKKDIFLLKWQVINCHETRHQAEQEQGLILNCSEISPKKLRQFQAEVDLLRQNSHKGAFDRMCLEFHHLEFLWVDASILAKKSLSFDRKLALNETEREAMQQYHKARASIEKMRLELEETMKTPTLEQGYFKHLSQIKVHLFQQYHAQIATIIQVVKNHLAALRVDAKVRELDALDKKRQKEIIEIRLEEWGTQLDSLYGRAKEAYETPAPLEEKHKKLDPFMCFSGYLILFPSVASPDDTEKDQAIQNLSVALKSYQEAKGEEQIAERYAALNKSYLEAIKHIYNEAKEHLERQKKLVKSNAQLSTYFLRSRAWYKKKERKLIELRGKDDRFLLQKMFDRIQGIPIVRPVKKPKKDLLVSRVSAYLAATQYFTCGLHAFSDS